MNMNQTNISPAEPLRAPLDQRHRLLNRPPNSHVHLVPATERLMGPRISIQLKVESLRGGEPRERFASREAQVGVEGLQELHQGFGEEQG